MEDREDGRLLFNLLCRFPERVVEAAKLCLGTRRAQSLVRLVILVRQLGTPALIDYLRPLIDHHDRQVRIEVLEALVKFKDPNAADVLRRFLQTKVRDDLLRAIEIAGRYKVEEVAQDLTSMVKRFLLFKRDYQKNERIIEALARIGHPCGIPVLEKLARTTWSLYPQCLSSMKLQIFHSLRFYEDSYLASLLKIGSQSADSRIRNACRARLENAAYGQTASHPMMGTIQEAIENGTR
jgi:hypothetical protein